jgi:hypothetical protein
MGVRLLPLVVCFLACSGSPVVSGLVYEEGEDAEDDGDSGDDDGGEEDDDGDADDGGSDGEIDEVGDAPGADELWEDDEILEFELQLSAASYAALEASPFEWAEGTFIYGDLELSPVGIRTKGHQSWQPIGSKPSLKIKFDEYVDGMEFLGLEELTFNAMNTDYSMLHERLAYRMWRESDVMAPRAQHAWIVLNGEDYGLYVNVEVTSKTMARRWYDGTGTMWEFASADFQDAYIPGFDHKWGKDDRSLMYEAADILTGTASEELWEDLDEYIDVDHWFRYWGVSAYVAQYDSYPYRYPGDDANVYFDPESGQFKVFPHGVDETFYFGTTSPESGVIALLGTQCLQVESCQQNFHTAIQDSLDVAEAIDMHGYFLEVQDQIQPYVDADPKRGYAASDVALYQASVEDMILTRPETLAALLGW